MVDTMIDTQLVISDERKTKKSVTLPYQLDISMYTNWITLMDRYVFALVRLIQS